MRKSFVLELHEESFEHSMSASACSRQLRIVKTHNRALATAIGESFEVPKEG
jgi:hypothetical protein